MLTINGMSLTISQGDTLSIVFCLSGYNIRASDTIHISIKRYDTGAIAAASEVTGITGTQIFMNVPADVTETWPPGMYIYDITVINDAGRRTLNYPAMIRVLSTAHEVGGECCGPVYM